MGRNRDSIRPSTTVAASWAATLAVLLCATTSVEGALRGGAKLRTRRLNPLVNNVKTAGDIPCNKNLPDLPYLPGVATLGYGFNIVTGKQVIDPLFGTDPSGDAWANEGTKLVGEKCYKVPDCLIDPKTGYSGVIEDHVDDFSFASASGSNTVNFRMDWANKQSNQFDLKGSYGAFSGHAAYTKSQDLNLVMQMSKVQKNATTRLHNDIQYFSMKPQQFKLLSSARHVLTGLVADDAPFRDDTGTIMDWETYFNHYGTHVLTEAAMGGRIVIQYFFESSTTKSGQSDVEKKSDCLSAGLTVGLGGNNATADTNNCWNTTNGVSVNASTALKSVRSHIHCDGGGLGTQSSCPLLSDGKLDIKALNAWKETLTGNNLHANVVSAEWITRQLAVIARQHGTDGYKVLGFDSQTQFQTVQSRLSTMLMRYLMENGMCGLYPGSCGSEQNAVGALQAVVATGAPLDITTAQVSGVLSKLNTYNASIDSFLQGIETLGGWTVAAIESSTLFGSPYQALNLAKTWLSKAETQIVLDNGKLHTSVGNLAAHVTEALTPPTDLPLIVPAHCTTTGGGVPEGSQCTFPFTYEGVTYDACTNVGHDKPWCSTETDANGIHVTDHWGNCECKDANAEARAAHAAAEKKVADGISAAQKELAGILNTTAIAVDNATDALSAITHALETAAKGFADYEGAPVPWNPLTMAQLEVFYTTQVFEECGACSFGCAYCDNFQQTVDARVAAAKITYASNIHLFFQNIVAEVKVVVAASKQTIDCFTPFSANLTRRMNDVIANYNVQKTQDVQDWWRNPILPELLALAHARPAADKVRALFSALVLPEDVKSTFDFLFERPEESITAPPTPSPTALPACESFRTKAECNGGSRCKWSRKKGLCKGI